MSPSTDQRENREFAAETKFLVPRPAAEEIRNWARAHLAPDPHASGEGHDTYRITSLYFDTERFDVFHRKGSFGRSKFRVRRYGSSDTVFLERKLKTRGLVSKRRSLVNIEELPRLLSAKTEALWTGNWYRQRLFLRQLRPVCEITYQRNARVLMTETGPIRLTLDDGLRAQSTANLVFNGVEHGTLLSEDNLILELKYRREMPALFTQLIRQFGLKTAAVSKYRLAARTLGLVPEPTASVETGAQTPQNQPEAEPRIVPPNRLQQLAS